MQPDPTVAQEYERHQTNTDRLRAFFLARPGVWVNAVDLEPAGGRQAWRTRVSELRVALERAGTGTIENRQRHGRVAHDATWVVSEYRYVPTQPKRVPVSGLLFDMGPRA